MALRKKLAFIRKLNLNPLSNLTTDGAIERERKRPRHTLSKLWTLRLISCHYIPGSREVYWLPIGLG